MRLSHEANDALVAASYFVLRCNGPLSAAMSILSRRRCLTFSSLHAGTTNNVIAETAFCMVPLDSDSGDEPLDPETLTRNSRGHSPGFGLELDLELKQGGYLPVENHPDLAGERTFSRRKKEWS